MKIGNVRFGDRADFSRLGFPRREIFSHRVIAIPKQYPDSCVLLERRGVTSSEIASGKFYQLNLYAQELGNLPEELFTNPEVNWHGQQLGQKGLIGAASLFVRNSAVIVIILQSDVCHQLFRHADLRRSCKSQVQDRFGRWYALLVNAVLEFCLLHHARVAYFPTAKEVMAGTRKQMSGDLFTRIYDYAGTRYVCSKVLRNTAEYWEVPVSPNADSIVRLRDAGNASPREDTTKRIAIFHDIEEDVDTPVSKLECKENLAAMLEIEKRLGVTGTYDVLGTLLNSKREEISLSNPAHSIAFHSYDHDVASTNQLERCRTVDLQIKGYRPPRSVVTEELSDSNLAYLNFEWLASSVRSLGFSNCRLENGIVKIP
ncbi:MAG: hypothetical protein JOZ62_07295, partial [Acidobacteriaceae bacterium]|nr:hypothetical protein [Acidobacteriaceae bacterium]